MIMSHASWLTAGVTALVTLAFATPDDPSPELAAARVRLEAIRVQAEAFGLGGQDLDRALDALASAERLRSDGESHALVRRQIRRARLHIDRAWQALAAHRRCLERESALAAAELDRLAADGGPGDREVVRAGRTFASL